MNKCEKNVISRNNYEKYLKYKELVLYSLTEKHPDKILKDVLSLTGGTRSIERIKETKSRKYNKVVCPDDLYAASDLFIWL